MAGDSLVTIIVIFLAVIIIFVFPMMTIAGKNDDVSQLAVQSKTAEFTTKIATTGKFSMQDWESFSQAIHSTGNTFDIKMERKVLDTNPAKKSQLANYTVIGENIYVSYYTTQILDELNVAYNASSNPNPEYKFNEGDIVIVTVKNTNKTLFDSFKDLLTTTVGDDAATIVGTSSMVVMENGK